MHRYMPADGRGFSWIRFSGVMRICILMFCAILGTTPGTLHADGVIVFNEIMYHPPVNEAAMEWVELFNQNSVDVDLSGWSVGKGIEFSFPEGTVIRGGGYLVVASSPSSLMLSTGLTNVFGPFSGRLSNSGETLELRNRNGRIMDTVSYGVDGDWPVGPDGGGVSLVKKKESLGGDSAFVWGMSPQPGGTPGQRNFPTNSYETTTTQALKIDGSWKYEASGGDPGVAWRESGFNDGGWSSGGALFQGGTVTVAEGAARTIPTVFSTGIDSNGVVISPGLGDPHYLLTKSPQGTPPPPSIPATVIQNHPAWVANDSAASWIGPVNPGTTSVAAGLYTYQTSFSLDGFDPSSATLLLNICADDRLTDVLLNGVSLGITYAGFTIPSSTFTISSGFVAGSNVLEFLVLNEGSGANPGGFRLKLSGSARPSISAKTILTSGRTNYYFRSTFTLDTPTRYASLQLTTLVADGAVFYLNGSEVLRWNMPPGLIGASSLAITNVASPAYLGPFKLSNTALVTGTNVLAVELHSAAGGISNVLFGASLSMTTTNLLRPDAVPIAFNEVNSLTNGDFWLEVFNLGRDEVDLGNRAILRRGGLVDSTFIFPPQTLAAGACLQVTEATLGFRPDAGDRLFLCDSSGGSVIDALAITTQARGRWPDGFGQWMFPSSATPGASNYFDFHHDVVINEVMYHPPAHPAIPATYGTNIMVAITNQWKFHGLGADLGTAWRTSGFNDSAWQSGSSLFYNTTSFLPAPKLTQLPLADAGGTRITTWYFRTPFVFLGDTVGAQLTLRPIVDDGAVYYLNGTEILRQNMPSGEIRYPTLSSTGVATPTFTGPYIISVTNLVVGTNLLAVEVHQFTTNPIAADMAFGVEVSAYTQLAPASPATESPDTWVELFNRGTNVADLTGWRLDTGIDYRFPPGTGIAGGGYLVVAKDVGFMRSNYPGVSVVGPYTNKLSHSSDLLILKDSMNNPANSVRYFGGGRWPDSPDGGGSSLELVDPWADSSRAEAWAASDETVNSYWSNYTYRAVARSIIGPTIWNEFVLGLLDSGECLIDDLHVVESPDTAPVELLQNGSFETGLNAWRVLGDHARSRVEAEKGNPSNHVLHLVATGPTDHMHNHLETTLANGRTVVDGREYQISFRAKWISGNNRLNTRLYFNRVAKTTALAMPSRFGTPGVRNSMFVQNLGPTFAVVHHAPTLPQPGQAVTVSASVSDPQGVSSVVLRWKVDGGAWQTLPMLPDGPSVLPGYTNYSAMVPAQPAGTLVQFFIQAADGATASASFPARGADSRAFFKVDDGAGRMAQLHRLRMLMSAADAALLHAPTNVMSNDHLGLTVVYDEEEVFYDVGIHLQRSERGRSDSSSVGFTLEFSPDQLFRGVHKGVTVDRSGGFSGLGGRHEEILLWHALNHAGGVPGLECDVVQVFAPRSQENSTGLMRLAAFDNDYFKSQFQNGDQGGRYQMELIYYPTTTLTGDAQSPKLPQPDEVINIDFQDWGGDPENYRWIFLQENGADLDDYSQMIALNRAFGLTGSAQDVETRRLVDVDEWLRALAFKTLTGDVDTYTTGLNHNWKVYIRPEDGRAVGLLWDMDLSFLQPINSPFPGNGSASTYRMIMIPDNYRRYCNHLLDMITTSVNSGHLSPWAGRYGNLLGQNWGGAVNYLQQRGDFIRGSMPLSTPFAITSNGGNNFSTTNDHVVLAGTAPLTVKEILINGLSCGLTWTTLTNWTLTAPLPGAVNLLVAQGIDSQGGTPTNVVDSIVVTNRGVLPPGPVVLNEWMADNAAPGGFADSVDGMFQDWIELYNPNEIPVNLSGFFLTDTLTQPAKWQIPTNTIIAPHGFLLVWADGDIGQNGLGTNGDLHANFQLSRSGEAIALFNSDGLLQDSVVFGPQIQNVSQGLFPDGKVGSVYYMENWSPRSANRFGNIPAPSIKSAPSGGHGVVAFQCQVLPGRTYRVEYKDAITDPVWIRLGADVNTTGSTLLFQDGTGASNQRFYRVLLLR